MSAPAPYGSGRVGKRSDCASAVTRSRRGMRRSGDAEAVCSKSHRFAFALCVIAAESDGSISQALTRGLALARGERKLRRFCRPVAVQPYGEEPRGLLASGGTSRGPLGLAGERGARVRPVNAASSRARARAGAGEARGVREPERLRLAMGVRRPAASPPTAPAARLLLLRLLLPRPLPLRPLPRRLLPPPPAERASLAASAAARARAELRPPRWTPGEAAAPDSRATRRLRTPTPPSALERAARAPPSAAPAEGERERDSDSPRARSPGRAPDARLASRPRARGRRASSPSASSSLPCASPLAAREPPPAELLSSLLDADCAPRRFGASTICVTTPGAKLVMLPRLSTRRRSASSEAASSSSSWALASSPAAAAASSSSGGTPSYTSYTSERRSEGVPELEALPVLRRWGSPPPALEAGNVRQISASGSSPPSLVLGGTAPPSTLRYCRCACPAAGTPRSAAAAAAARALVGAACRSAPDGSPRKPASLALPRPAPPYRSVPSTAVRAPASPEVPSPLPRPTPRPEPKRRSRLTPRPPSTSALVRRPLPIPTSAVARSLSIDVETDECLTPPLPMTACMSSSRRKRRQRRILLCGSRLD